MAQWIKSLLSEHEDLSVNPQHPHKIWAGDSHHNPGVIEANGDR